MNKITLLNMDNMEFTQHIKGDMIFADYVYENLDFSWAYRYWTHNLKRNGIFIAVTDFHSASEFDVFMKNELNATFINHLVWKNEWGNHPKNRFHQCYDDVFIYCKGDEWKFYSDRIQVPKATAKSKGLNRFGRNTKTATAWIDDICLTTVSKERIKKDDGHLIRWQKPEALLERLMLPFLDDGDTVIDPFMGSGTAGVVCGRNNWKYYGIENDLEPYLLAKKRIEENANL